MSLTEYPAVAPVDPGTNAKRGEVMRPVTLLAAVLALACSIAGAQAAALGVGATVRPLGTLPLRDAPPVGIFSFKGNEIGSVGTANAYTIVDTKTVGTLFGTETWVKLQSTSDRSKVGWVYTGSDDRPFQNVVPRR